MKIPEKRHHAKQVRRRYIVLPDPEISRQILVEDTEILAEPGKFRQIPKNLAGDNKTVARPRKIRLLAKKFRWTEKKTNGRLRNNLAKSQKILPDI